MHEDAPAPGGDAPEFVSTGVEGLDDILGGGFRRGGFYLVQGDPGSGKTTIAIQFARASVARGDSVAYITLTESLDDLEMTARSHGWSLDGVEIVDLTRTEAPGEAPSTLFHPAETELGETTRAILAAIERANPRCVVFDGIGELRLLAGDAFTYRRQMLALKRYFADHGTTVALFDDRTHRFDDVQAEMVVGGNILLEKQLPGYGGARRRLCVTKVRGFDFRTGYHDYEIHAREGVVVYPRLAVEHNQHRYEEEVFSSGVPGLDDMLGGGLTSGTTSVMLGPAGVGKSTIAMQFVATALERGYPAAVYTFDEVLNTLFERSEKLGAHGIRGFAESGLLIARQVNPAEMTPGAFAHEVRMAVRDRGVRIVVIDSLNGYVSAMPEERFLQTHLHELFAYLNELGILSIIVVAQHGVLQADSNGIDVSYLADTVLLLRYFESDAEVRQAINVFKKRTGLHERSLREFGISGRGLSVGEPLRQFRGILTGVPQNAGVPRYVPPAAGGSGGAEAEAAG